MLLAASKALGINWSRRHFRFHAPLYGKVRLNSRPCLAIRRETVSLWERRAPLAPRQVRHLVQDGITVLVQPSNRRAFTSLEYAQAGAIIQDDISEASLIVGVKQVPIDHRNLMPNKTYAFFSHTIKAQEGNMALLEACLERNIRLVDYERLLDDNGNRLVAFGQYAGVAGMINILHGLGLRLLALGHHTPFMHIGPAHNYRSVGMAKQSIRDAGYDISLGNMPQSIGPLTFVFTGSGNVSKGAQEMFLELPFEFVELDHLEQVSKHGATNKVYGCVVRRSDHFQRREGGGFDAQEFDLHPERYVSTFSLKVAPYASCVVNGIYWAPKAPRLLSIPDAKHLLREKQEQPWLQTSPGCPTLPHKLLAICDISADPGGSIEFMKECTTIDKPFCLYDAEENMSTEQFDGPGVLICSIDNMPTQLPRESTDYFGQKLLPHVKDMLKSDASTPFDQFTGSKVVRQACITSNGSLTPPYEYIKGLRDSLRASRSRLLNAQSASRSVLLLGAGRVASPVVEYLTRDPSVRVTIVSQDKIEAEEMANRYANTNPIAADIVNDFDLIEKLVSEHEVAVSLLPYSFHQAVLGMCLRGKRHLVTASYANSIPNLHEMNSQLEAAGISCIMEVGLDPGIDHLLAKECIDDALDKGGKVISYISHTGGLPAPEFSDNPLRYKFAWSPEGALRACLNPCKYKIAGKIVEVEKGGKLMRSSEPLNLLPGFNLEMIPNRDSLVYAKLYGIEDAHTVLRGTLRYKGYCDVIWSFIRLGLMSADPHPLLHPAGPDITWKKFMCNSVGKPLDVFTGTVKDAVFKRLGEDRIQFDALDKLRLFDDELLIKKCGSPLETLANFLGNQLAFESGERDIVIMTHQITIQYQDRSEENRFLQLVVNGEPNGFSAMARTVGYPTAIAVRMLLDEEIKQRGVVLPLNSNIYRPMLRRLKKEGIGAIEKIYH